MLQEFLRHRVLRAGLTAIAVGSALSLAACGRMGDLEPPPGVENPAPPVGTPRKAPEEGERPEKPFVLDGIL
ncbi:MAG: lipoprotein [Tepidamorphaceae bacterium]